MVARKRYLGLMALVTLVYVGCSGRNADRPAPQPAPGSAAVVSPSGSPAGRVILSLRRDSLGLEPGASDSATARAIQTAIITLQQVKAFEVLSTLPPIYAVLVRPRDGGSVTELIKALSGHRLVLAAEPDGIVTADSSSNQPD